MKKIKEKHIDAIFSRFIRLRDKYRCVFCRKKYVHSENKLDCSHFYTRSARSTRWDEENCDTLCKKCHQYHEDRKNGEYYDFKQRQLGETGFDNLRKRFYNIKKWSQSDKNELYDLYKKKVDDLVRKREGFIFGKRN